MITYLLYYLADSDDCDPKTFTTDNIVHSGDVIKLDTGLYHVVTHLREQKRGVQLVLSKSGQTHEEAVLLAAQYKHWPKSGRLPS